MSIEMTCEEYIKKNYSRAMEEHRDSNIHHKMQLSVFFGIVLIMAIYYFSKSILSVAVPGIIVLGVAIYGYGLGMQMEEDVCEQLEQEYRNASGQKKMIG